MEGGTAVGGTAVGGTAEGETGPACSRHPWKRALAACSVGASTTCLMPGGTTSSLVPVAAVRLGVSLSRDWMGEAAGSSKRVATMFGSLTGTYTMEVWVGTAVTPGNHTHSD